MLKMEMKRRRRRDYSSLRMIDSVEQHCGYPCILIWLKEVINTVLKFVPQEHNSGGGTDWTVKE
jgi:hypothetical protein